MCRCGSSSRARLWLAVDYAIGNVIWRPGHVFGAHRPDALSNSLADAILNWWYAHNLFGLWLTPMLIALTYYIVPRITNTPLYSYTLSLISFWGMAFLYTGVGDHHILQSPTPAWLKTMAEISSFALLIPVFAFTINILGTMKGNWDKFFTNLTMRFTMTAFFFYFLVNVQGAFEALQPFNKLQHFTNFVVAHAHLALLGAFTILGMGVIDYIVAQIYRPPAMEPQPDRMAVLAGDGRLHRVLQRAHPGRLPAGLQLAGGHPRGQRAGPAPPLLHRARHLRGDDRHLGDRPDGEHRDDDGQRHAPSAAGARPSRSPSSSRRRWRAECPRRRPEREPSPSPSPLRRRPAAGPRTLPSGCSSLRGSPGIGRAARVPRRGLRGGVAADPHLRPAGLQRLGAALSNQAVKGRDLFASNDCFVCHSGYTRPQDVRESLYFLYPKVSQPGDYYGVRPVAQPASGPSARAPTSPRRGAGIPTTGSGRTSTTRATSTRARSCRQMHALFSDKQVDQLVSFVEERSGKSGLLRYAGQLYAKHVVITNQGFPPPYTGFQGAHKPIVPQKDVKPPANQLEEAPNLAQIDRGYWLSGDPLPVTEQNLMRGKEVFDERCVGLPRHQGRRQGSGGATSCRRRPADFTDKDDACCGGDTGPGDFYYRILRGWTGHRDGELRRAALGGRHLARGAVRQDDPQRHAGQEPGARALRLHRLAALQGAAGLDGESTRRCRTTRRSSRRAVTDPFMQEAMRVFPGLAPGRPPRQSTAWTTPLNLADAAAGIKAIYNAAPRHGVGRRPQGRAATSCRRAPRRHPARRGGPAVSRGSSPRPRGSAARCWLPGRRARARRARERRVEVGDGRLDDGRVLPLRGLRRGRRSSSPGRQGTSTTSSRPRGSR